MPWAWLVGVAKWRISRLLRARWQGAPESHAVEVLRKPRPRRVFSAGGGTIAAGPGCRGMHRAVISAAGLHLTHVRTVYIRADDPWTRY